MEKRWPDHSLRVGIFFFLYSLGSLALAITCHLRDSQAVASNAVFPATRARARFRPDLDIGSGLHPPEIWNAGIDYACLQACLVNQPSDFSIARFPTPPRAQKTTNDYDYCVKSMFDKPFSNAVHPENRARKKLRQTFYHSALFVSEKKKKIRGIAMSVRGLSRWIIGSSTSSSRWIIISSSGIGKIGKLLAIRSRLFYSNHCEDRG